MKVRVLSLTEEAIEGRCYRDELSIEVDGSVVFNVSDGEPEDSNLSRDFSDCFSIPNLMNMAYKAGKNNEELEISYEEVEEL